MSHENNSMKIHGHILTFLPPKLFPFELRPPKHLLKYEKPSKIVSPSNQTPIPRSNSVSKRSDRLTKCTFYDPSTAPPEAILPTPPPCHHSEPSFSHSFIVRRAVSISGMSRAMSKAKGRLFVFS